MKLLPDGSMPYKGVIDCTRQIFVKEGPLAFYKVRVRSHPHDTRTAQGPCKHHLPPPTPPQGLSTYVARIAPHVIITLILLEHINNFARETLKLK